MKLMKDDEEVYNIEVAKTQQKEAHKVRLFSLASMFVGELIKNNIEIVNVHENKIKFKDRLSGEEFTINVDYGDDIGDTLYLGKIQYDCPSQMIIKKDSN